MTRHAVALLLFASGCFSPKVPASSDGSTSDGGTGASTTGSSTADTTVATVTASSSESGASESGPNLPPTVLLTLDGEAEPNAIDDHTIRMLIAEIEDDGSIVGVDFFRGDVPLATVSSPPFELALPLSSVDSGLLSLRAVATDDAGQAGEDDLEVSVNIAGGNAEDLQANIGQVAMLVVENVAIVGGGASFVDGRLYTSGITATGNGFVSSFLPELEEQWTEEIRVSTGVRSAPQGAGQGQIAVASTESGNWVVRILSRATGTTDDAWILGPQPPSSAGLGPQLAANGQQITATTSISRFARFALDGTELEAETLLEPFVVSQLVPASDGSLVYASFGDPFQTNDTTCATDSEYCAVAVDAKGDVPWITGLDEISAAPFRLAPTLDGGVFAAASLSGIGASAGYQLGRISPQGVVQETVLDGVFGRDETGDQVVSLAATPGGGVVVCGTRSFTLQGGPAPTPFANAYSADLNPVWDAFDFAEHTENSFLIGCAASFEAVYAYGLRDPNVETLNGVTALVGDAWIARISL